MTSDHALSEGQDQSDLFRGVSGPADLTESESIKGTPASRLPAFVLGEELADLADRDSRIVVLTADLASANRTVEFKARHPDRFFDFGIAEKNMITAAAGLAACGQVPYAATFAAFSAILGAEQIRSDCAYPDLPVRIIGTHSGISMGFYGTSHHATEDLGMLRTVANLTVVCTTDANHLRAVLRASVDHPGAIYIRLGRGRDPEVYPEVPAVTFGRAIRLREGGDLTIIATGAEVRPALDAAGRLAEQGIETRVVDMHTIKPLDEGEVRAAAAETGAILTVEEHNVIGGLGSAVAEILVDCERVPFRRHGIKDEFAPVGPPDGKRHVFEWQAGSLFSVPVNAWHRIVNATSSPALLLAGTTAPNVMNMFNSVDLAFNCPYQFHDRFSGADDFYKPKDDIEPDPIRGLAMLRTNLVPDIFNCELPLDNRRCPGWRRVEPFMTGNTFYLWVGEHETGRYSKAHAHTSAAVLICVRGKGYTYTWPERLGVTPWRDGHADQVRRVDYEPVGMVTAPGGLAGTTSISTFPRSRFGSPPGSGRTTRAWMRRRPARS